MNAVANMKTRAMVTLLALVTVHCAAVSTDDTSSDETSANLTAGGSPFGGTPRAVPGLIQAEDYNLGADGVAYHDTTPGNSGGRYRHRDVDVEASVDEGGGFNVGWIATGEYLNYSVVIASAGTYDFALRLISWAADGGRVELEVDGARAGDAMTIPNTGNTWRVVTVPGIELPAGNHVITLSFASAHGTFDINWFSLTSSSTGGGGGDLPLTGVYETTGVDWQEFQYGPRFDSIGHENFALALSYDFPGESPDTIGTLAEIDQYGSYALSRGIKLILNFGSGIWRDGTAFATLRSFATGQLHATNQTDFIQKLIAFFATKPYVYGYYLADELPASDAPAVGSLRNLIRTRDTQHPTIVVLGWWLDQGDPGYYDAWLPNVDILGIDDYPLLADGTLEYNHPNSPANPGTIARDVQARCTAAGKKFAWVGQAFSFANYGGVSSQAWPTRAQMLDWRNQVLRSSSPEFILWYSFFDHFNNRQTSPDAFLEDVRAAAFAPRP